MKELFVLLFGIAFLESTASGDSIAVPWQDFKELYRADIERKILEKIPQETKKSLIAIEDVSYQLDIRELRGTGLVTIKGKVLEGRPDPIRLFGSDVIIKNIPEVTGGSIFTEAKGIFFLPNEAESFELKCNLLFPVREDQRSKYISFDIPSGIRNSVSIKLLQAPMKSYFVLLLKKDQFHL